MMKMTGQHRRPKETFAQVQLLRQRGGWRQVEGDAGAGREQAVEGGDDEDDRAAGDEHQGHPRVLRAPREVVGGAEQGGRGDRRVGADRYEPALWRWRWASAT